LIVDEGTLDRTLQERLNHDPRAGWRMFIEQYTSAMLAVIQRSGIRRHDEAMEVYVRVCEHLAADDCARLRRHDPGRGPLAAWLTVVVRRVIVDWVRSRKGRKRLFQSIRELTPFDRAVFELRYWQAHPVTTIVELLGGMGHGGVTLPDVFDALERIEQALSSRQRAELVAMVARTAREEPLDDEDGRPVVDPVDTTGDPERQLRRRQADEALAAALATLADEDALIVSMLYLDGLPKREVERALHIPPIPATRMRDILGRLRTALTERP